MTNPCIRDTLILLQKTAPAFDGEAHVYVAGGIAVAWWLQGKNEIRTTLDVDAIFEGKVRPDAMIPAREGCVGLDVNYSHLFESYGYRTEVGASAST